MIHIEEINPGNWKVDLKVAKEQEGYVSNPMRLLARAYAFRMHRSVACMIYNDETPVGMALYHDCDDMQAYDFSQLFIDEQYQGNGYGKEAAKILIERMREEKKYNKIVLCYIEGNEVAKSMYESLGFRHTGDADEDEIVMELCLD